MLYVSLLSFGLSVILLILSLVLRLAGKLRLTLPVLYFLLISTVLNPWAAAHERLALTILGILTAFSVLSWLGSLVHWIQEKKYEKAMEEDLIWQIERAKERGLPLDHVYVDHTNTLRYADTGEEVK